ncbi:MAG: hypothetical protein M5U26_23825 [Planctomycetota bacterium]|nr:hypothetical protein [Planctomycetota bacterium]
MSPRMLLALVLACVLNWGMAWCADEGGKTREGKKARAAEGEDAESEAPAEKDDVPVPLTGAVIYTMDAPPSTPALEVLEERESITQFGITWTFDRKARVGQFITRDWYVVGPVKIVKIAPQPLFGSEVKAQDKGAVKESKLDANKLARNGSTLNFPAVAPREKAGKGYNGAGFDSRIPAGRYDPELFTPLPIEMKPGDSLVSSISKEELGDEHNLHIKCVKLVAVLSCVAEPQPPDAFRPSFSASRTCKPYLARNLKRELLHSLKRPTTEKYRGAATPSIPELVRAMQMPWCDGSGMNLGTPLQNFPLGAYGANQATTTGMAALYLNLDYTPAEKEPLLLNLIQVGIDDFGMARDGRTWPAHGGLNSGRKWPIVFAGMLLDDPEMKELKKTLPDSVFQEDQQTALCPVTYRGQTFERGWTGAKAVFMGHSIEGFGGARGSWEGGFGPVDLFHPKDWPDRPSGMKEGLKKS